VAFARRDPKRSRVRADPNLQRLVAAIDRRQSEATVGRDRGYPCAHDAQRPDVGGEITAPRPRSNVMSFVVHQTPAGRRCVLAHNTDVVPGCETKSLMIRAGCGRSALATRTDSNGLSKTIPGSSSRHVPRCITTYAKKCRSDLCRNCVRSPRKYPQTPTFTGSHQEAFCGGKSLNRLRKEMLRYYSMQLAGIAFQACSLNHSDISPLRIIHLRPLASHISES
jgi:hypothetical protein